VPLMVGVGGWFVCVVWLVVDWDFVGDCVCDFLDADDVYVCVI